MATNPGTSISSPSIAHQPLALVNARLIDPDQATETRGGVLVADGFIRDLGASITADALPPHAQIIDCGGDVVAPGLIDMRAFLGEPGAEHRETIASATAAAAAGGITTILMRPDTTPPVDEAAVVDFLLRRARDTGRVRVLPAAALTKGLQGLEIAEIGLLQQAGAIAFSDGARSVRNAQVMRRALAYASDFDALIIHHAEDPDLAAGGMMNEGEFASRLGLTGIPREAEAIMLDRDMRLVNLTRARYHAALVTTTLSVEIIKRAKAAGLPVTCATSINHLTLNENDIGDYRTFLKLAPPLRHEDERRALVEALAEGVIDIVVSDHNPQDVETKRLPFAEAEDGAIGLETMLSAGLRLVTSGEVSLFRLLHAMSTKPAEVLGLPQGRLAKGAPADLIRFDPAEPYVVDRTKLHSRSKNTPFDDARMEGRVKLTLVGGKIAHETI
ncbi:dihydroorotase [Methyloferula stellata]|uniref:dihydroorotase n=1 Tax=Methyloferula stellata TaxID=876270 RepID=UPI00037E0523|nr:dihydroorotase [Methyloferula stellata]